MKLSIKKLVAGGLVSAVMTLGTYEGANILLRQVRHRANVKISNQYASAANALAKRGWRAAKPFLQSDPYACVENAALKPTRYAARDSNGKPIVVVGELADVTKLNACLVAHAKQPAPISWKDRPLDQYFGKQKGRVLFADTAADFLFDSLVVAAVLRRRKQPVQQRPCRVPLGRPA